MQFPLILHIIFGGYINRGVNLDNYLSRYDVENLMQIYDRNSLW